MRVKKLREKMQRHDLDGLLITDPANRRYLSGFTGSTATLLVTADQTMIMVDFRYFERAELEAPGWEQVRVTTGRREALVDMVRLAGVRRMGIEADHMTVAQWREAQDDLTEVELVPVKEFVLPIRAIKEEQEIQTIRAAVGCADAAFAHVCQVIRPGMTEREVAWELEKHMREHGASGPSFPFIVGSGPNGAMPHATSSERVIQVGEPIVMDFGAIVDGYCSDITRTVCLGECSERYRDTWQLVLEAHLEAKEGIRPGMTGQEADAIARDLFAKAGFTEAFGHGLGHGVGLNIHEKPFMSRLSKDDVLETGMVLTVEPGLYFSGWGGVRIEDIVIVRQDGVEVLTKAAKEPVLMV
jgi:Xaa-Pro aminopeptidase